MALTPSLVAQGCVSGAPCYTDAGLVNAASNLPGALAPNTLATLYGKDLAYSTRALTPDDVRDGILPTRLAGVMVLVGPIPAPLYYVSPGQINFLVPGRLVPGRVEVTVVRESRAGPAIAIWLSDSAPAVFNSGSFAAAVHGDGAAITPASPARPGEAIALFATGLGPAEVRNYDQIPRQPSLLTRLADFSLLLGDIPVDPARVVYAGVAPGFLGLYQINVVLPEDAPANPQLRLGFPERLSPEGVKLPLDPSGAPPG